MKRIYGDTPARLLTYVDMDGPGGCWIWLRSRQPSGYGQLKVDGKTIYAHRALYELIRGQIPEGKHIDHLCRVRACCNPWHLEVVDPIENWRRGQSPTRLNADKTHCSRGHSLVDAYRDADGHRECRPCRLDTTRRKRRSAA